MVLLARLLMVLLARLRRVSMQGWLTMRGEFPGCRLSVVELTVSASSSESVTTAALKPVGLAIRSISWL
jgi:hypothetical protein